MYWLLTLIFVTTTEAVIFTPVVIRGGSGSGSKKCAGPDNCGSGTTYCDIAFNKLVDDKYKSELCASNYLQSIEKCNNFTCLFKSIPENSCKCDTDINTVYNCTDAGSNMCKLKFRGWKYACDAVSYCVSDSINQIKKCNEKDEENKGKFADCVHDIVADTNCSLDVVDVGNHAHEPPNFDANKHMVMIFMSALFLFVL